MKRLLAQFCSLAAALVLVAGCGDDGRAGDAAGDTAISGVTTTAGPAPTTAPAPTAPVTTGPLPTTGGPAVTTAPGVVNVVVRVGVDDAATTGGRVEQVPVGSMVRVELSADEAIEYHLHEPYDIEVRGGPGEVVVIEFTADQPGQVELERHDTGAVLVLFAIS